MKERIQQMLEVSCMLLICVANINWKCRTYKNSLLHAIDSVLKNIVTGNKLSVTDNMRVFSRVCKLRKATISFVMSVRLSVHTEYVGFHWTDFREICCFSIFR